MSDLDAVADGDVAEAAAAVAAHAHVAAAHGREGVAVGEDAGGLDVLAVALAGAEAERAGGGGVRRLGRARRAVGEENVLAPVQGRA